MKTYSCLFDKLISLNNLEDAYKKARKGKTHKPAIQEFEKHWQLYLVQLYKELKTKKYVPRPLLPK